ncbi:hypothetical protein B0H13DRAFT_1901528 [Mycena leptocephala]|nr:hypothetical protein B0H13DRAFT_1901528 [Mycena leptocephala]
MPESPSIHGKDGRGAHESTLGSNEYLLGVCPRVEGSTILVGRESVKERSPSNDQGHESKYVFWTLNRKPVDSMRTCGKTILKEEVGDSDSTSTHAKSLLNLHPRLRYIPQKYHAECMWESEFICLSASREYVLVFENLTVRLSGLREDQENKRIICFLARSFVWQENAVQQSQAYRSCNCKPSSVASSRTASPAPTPPTSLREEYLLEKVALDDPGCRSMDVRCYTARLARCRAQGTVAQIRIESEFMRNFRSTIGFPPPQLIGVLASIQDADIPRLGIIVLGLGTEETYFLYILPNPIDAT